MALDVSVLEVVARGGDVARVSARVRAVDILDAGLLAAQHKLTDDWMGRLRVYGPGGYGNDGDSMEPDFSPAT